MPKSGVNPVPENDPENDRFLKSIKWWFWALFTRFSQGFDQPGF